MDFIWVTEVLELMKYVSRLMMHKRMACFLHNDIISIKTFKHIGVYNSDIYKIPKKFLHHGHEFECCATSP